MIMKLIAFLLMFNNNWLALKLLDRARKTPYTHLPGYMMRYWLFRTKWVSARFHVILRADHGRHLHDHPFWFRSIILQGSYMEELKGGKTKFYHPGDINEMEPDTFHRIAAIRGDCVWTLVFHGPKLPKSWGFLIGKVRIHHKKYWGSL